MREQSAAMIRRRSGIGRSGQQGVDAQPDGAGAGDAPARRFTGYEAVKHEDAEHAGRIRPDVTTRFASMCCALRVHETGMTRSNSQTLIAEHADWRFLNELKCEMKT
jgi:hypothetical protein